MVGSFHKNGVFMIKPEKQFLLWLVAGIIFLAVSIHDIFFAGSMNKSGMIIALEVIGGFCFILLALIQWRKYKNEKVA